MNFKNICDKCNTELSSESKICFYCSSDYNKNEIQNQKNDNNWSAISLFRIFLEIIKTFGACVLLFIFALPNIFVIIATVAFGIAAVFAVIFVAVKVIKFFWFF